MNQRKLEEKISELITEFNKVNGCFIGKATLVADGFRGGKPHYRLVLESHTENDDLIRGMRKSQAIENLRSQGIL